MKTIKVNDGTFTTEDFQHSREIELIGEVAQALRDPIGSAAPHRAETPWAVRIEFTNGDEPGVKLTATKARKDGKVITGQQIRAARELLGWTPYRLPRALA